MIYGTLGPLKFADFSGAPEVAQTNWDMSEREGIEGVQYEDAGMSPGIFTASVMTDVLNWQTAHNLLREWQAMVSQAAQPLTLGGYSYPNYYKLLRVSAPHAQRVVVVYGGVTQSVLGVPGTAICRAQFVLREWMPGSY
jgi:hypothetical protein